jgi:hypothetical protein
MVFIVTTMKSILFLLFEYYLFMVVSSYYIYF